MTTKGIAVAAQLEVLHSDLAGWLALAPDIREAAFSKTRDRLECDEPNSNSHYRPANGA